MANFNRICKEHMQCRRYSIEVIDLIARPQLAEGDQILALPTLVRRLPEPIKKIIGDLEGNGVYLGRELPECIGGASWG